jgi:hypothetical protein
MAKISNGNSLGRSNIKPKTIAIEPMVSDTERLCSLKSTDRLVNSAAVPQNQNIKPPKIQM